MVTHLGICVALLVSASGLAAQDTLLVMADNRPVWGSDPELVEELRIGSIAGDERFTFGLVAGVAVTRDGSIWVSDRMLGTIRRYSEEGIHLGDTGRRGEGPGEFNYLMDLRLLSDGSVGVWDPLNHRIHIFDEAGRFDSDIRVPVRGMLMIPQNFETDTAGNLYAIAPSVSRSSKIYWLRLNRDGVLTDTVYMVPSRREGIQHPIRTHTAVSPMGYLVVGRNSEYSFDRALPDGRIVRIERTFQPVRYEGAERTEAQQWENIFAERNGISARRIPDHKPVWSSFEIDTEGRIWVERYVKGERVAEREVDRTARAKFGNPERTWGQQLVYDVIDPRGRFLGSLRFPNSASATARPSIDIVLARGDRVWTVERGAFDEQYVVRYRIVTVGG